MSTNDPPDDARSDEQTEETAVGGPPTGRAGEAESDGLFDDRITEYNWLVGVLAGTWTFVGGYLLMAAIMLPTANFAGQGVSQFRAIGHVLFNAHQVDIVATLADGTAVSVAGLPTNYITETDPSLPGVVYYAVPVVVLLAGGALLAARTVSSEEYEPYVLPSVSLTVGYLGMALFTRFFVEDSLRVTGEGGQTTVTWGPELLPTVIYGLIYPLVLATAASLAVAVWRSRR